jgi:hypothetical protein
VVSLSNYAGFIFRFDSHRIVNAEPGMSKAFNHRDDLPINPAFGNKEITSQNI